MVKSTRMDLCYELTKLFIYDLGDNVADYKEICGFRYMPVPMGARDLSGFMDGTRNPDHLLRAIVDEVVIFPEDSGISHTGGSYMYTGKFVHNLQKFNSFKDEEKNNIIGRDYNEIKPHVGYDRRPENPQIKNPSPEAHIRRSYAAMYRHAMPFRQEKEEGLYFVGCCRSLIELNTAIDRMCGLFSDDGKKDNLFKFTKAVTSNYYYVPSLIELKSLEERTLIKEPKITKLKEKDDGKIIIFIEYCTNCGYKTLFLEQKKQLQSLSDDITVIGNPVFPRLSAYEVQIKDGPLLWSKLSQLNGRNNYPEVFPKIEILVKGLQEYLGKDVKLELKKTENVLGTDSGIW